MVGAGFDKDGDEAGCFKSNCFSDMYKAGVWVVATCGYLWQMRRLLLYDCGNYTLLFYKCKCESETSKV